ncbi:MULTISPECIES: acyltransferase family protein [Sphingobacterium]|uniref:Acyltransferase family protein n=1 Tax=Sphingobacterium tenebrionis TaxID=3111775 RepID=A0ABU8I6F5_9SPHI|nr:acyltransferase family protein [Sphingobacterium sp. CZ-2]QBR11240.1 acyltransferase [Sphingobacterium sp. CZ-2]
MNSISFIAIIGILYLLSISLWKKKYVPFTIEQSNSFKGILSILIVLSHLNFHAEMPLFLTITKWAGTKVALFFFISGYGLMASYRKKEQSYLQGFLGKRLWKIILPLLVITFFFLFTQFLDKGIFNLEIFQNLWIGLTPLPYSWFAYIILIFYLVFFVVFSTKWSLKIKIISMFSISLIISYLLYQKGFDRAWWVSNLAFPFGMLFQAQESRLIGWSRTKFGNILFVPICLGLAFIFAFFKIEFLYIFSYVFIVLAVVILLSYSGLSKGSIFNFLGKISYETYLIHGVLYFILRGNHIFIQNNWLYLGVSILSTIFLATLFHKLFNYIYTLKK